MAEIPSDAIQLGRVGYTDKGAYDSAATYNKYNTVSFNGAVWVCKQNNVTGVEPSESTTWHEILRGTTKATADTAGIIKPDNITVKVDNDGVLSTDLGLVVNDDGLLCVEYEEV